MTLVWRHLPRSSFLHRHLSGFKCNAALQGEFVLKLDLGRCMWVKWSWLPVFAQFYWSLQPDCTGHASSVCHIGFCSIVSGQCNYAFMELDYFCYFDKVTLLLSTMPMLLRLANHSATSTTGLLVLTLRPTCITSPLRSRTLPTCMVLSERHVCEGNRFKSYQRNMWCRF